MNNVLVIGCGHQGLAMAGHLSLNKVNVNLWNRTEKNISDLLKFKKIKIKGIINGDAYIQKISSNILDVYTDYIMVTTPANSYEDIAKILAPLVTNNTTIILNPGRTLGARCFLEHLKDNGCKYSPKIAETQTIVYTCRKSEENEAIIYAFKKNIYMASENADIKEIYKDLPKCLQEYFYPVDSTMITSLGNVGMVLHCAPVLMNIGWIENSVAKFEYYYEGITESVAKFLEKLDCERVNIAKELGFKIETVSEWMNRTYGLNGGNLYDSIKQNNNYRGILAPDSLNHRYLLEDVSCGLVPLESIGKYYGIETPNVKLVIDLANSILETDFRKIGRKFVK